MSQQQSNKELVGENLKASYFVTESAALYNLIALCSYRVTYLVLSYSFNFD